MLVEVYQMDHTRSSRKIRKSVKREDFISNLPDGLKDKILCCLPIKEAVATCLLSRNWRYTWTSMTELMFRGDDFASENGNADDDKSRFLKFIDMFLSLHDGPILKFGLNTSDIVVSTGGHIYRWMRILSRKRIKELQLRTTMQDCYKIPSSFFSCHELESAQLHFCKLTTPQLPLLSKGFKQLHTLHLQYCYILRGNNFGDLVASCPNLNKLILNSILSLADINIHSTKLKVLTVDGHFNHLNLHTPYLTSAVIKLRPLSSDAFKTRCNFNFSQFIASLSDVEDISLLGPILERAEHEFLVLKPPKSFNRLKKISLDLDLGNLKEANLALCLFQHAPCLQFIHLQLTSNKPIVSAVHFWESIDRLPECSCSWYDQLYWLRCRARLLETYT